jgi:hypothetical protein
VLWYDENSKSLIKHWPLNREIGYAIQALASGDGFEDIAWVPVAAADTPGFVKKVTL